MNKNESLLQFFSAQSAEIHYGLFLINFLLAALLAHLLGRAYADPSPFIRRFLSDQYAQMIARFKAAFGRALPQLPRRELSWRLHFIMGALSYTLAGTDALKIIAELTPNEADNDEILLRRLAPFLLAGLTAPLADFPDAGREAGDAPARAD